MVDSSLNVTTSATVRPSNKRAHSRRHEEDDAFLKLTDESSEKLEKLNQQENEEKNKEFFFGKVCRCIKLLETR
jgi:hypothetical protein